MISFDAQQVEDALPYDLLIRSLEDGFAEEKFKTPQRHHHNYPNPPHPDDSTLLMMPAWQVGKNLGVKIVNVTPANGNRGIPSIHGLYLYFDAATGVPLAIMDSNTITKKRTAATSALASKFLSRPDSSVMLMVGTGTLAPEMIKAHSMVRDLKKIYIWGRDQQKAETLADSLSLNEVEITNIKDLEQGVKVSDIITTATLASQPLIQGEWLNDGQHVDLVGSYKPDMREADDVVMSRSSVYIDSEGALHESGDLKIPIDTGVISKEDIKADLFRLCKAGEGASGRQGPDEITCFKSVGHALEDLVAAQMVYEYYDR